jgi:RNA polymerase sigma-70 factor (ECF subfamily)
VNGRPGFVSYRDGRPYAVTSVETDGQRILAVLRVLNPDKLGALAELGGPPSPPSRVA